MIRNKFSYVESISAEEIKSMLYAVLEENDDLKKKMLIGEQKSSIKFIKNSSSINFEIKVYNEDIGKAVKDAETIFKKLQIKYKKEEN
jgi:hypothetical protein